MWIVRADASSSMGASEAAAVHVSGESLSLTGASLLYCWTRWARLLLLQCLAVSAESPMNFSRAPISTGASRSSVGQGVRRFIISVCLYRKQRQSSSLSHFQRGPMRSVSSWSNYCPLQGSPFVQSGERELFSCKVRRQVLVSSLLGCAFFYICYLLRGHFLNVSDDIKRLLFLFIKQWLQSSQKQPPYFSSLLTPTPSLSHTPSSHRPSFCTARSCSY